MSHGHEHKDYKRVFGDVERASSGLIVLCDGQAPKAGTDVYQQSRAVCLGSTLKACETCEHNKFHLHLLSGIGDQIVACPTWSSIGDRLERVQPHYSMVRREQCLLQRPYDYCSVCPNQEVRNQPRTEPGWWEEEKWRGK